ncbi:GDP-Man:Man(3)GlcNAc(2)-PP-Dol alpha-1 [Escovopsis weberi]|uniref:GDP-Man:Man(3)GlcNAc(2)-PP-Dol alpha-1,2-mannosyltransferase n=1 Tax=Escovopsis weberi TaxID=150374 RepID=A0A0M8N8N2_ESCWE|nr:GDP-Man:Man(3)GlcNAc(2)-PP-Dol alpha-1 [Escovopsis weberi]
MADECAGLACLQHVLGRTFWLTLGAIMLVTSPFIAAAVLPLIARFLGTIIGNMLRKRTRGRRQNLVAFMDIEHANYLRNKRGTGDRRSSIDDANRSNKKKNNNTKAAAGGKPTTTTNNNNNINDINNNNHNPDDQDWDGVVGFFHPFCNAGGGGERVLWAAIRATQTQWPAAKCIVYTGDRDATKDDILSNVRNRFNIHLHPPTIQFLYLSQRHQVLPGRHFTLLAQSIGSMVLAWDAFKLLTPDIFVDTMGYAFALGLSKFLFADVPTGAYVHYPTISTDMLKSLNPDSAVGSQGVNAGQGRGLRGLGKRLYWEAFARLYSWMGASIDVVMTNSSWTQGHVRSLWGPHRRARDRLNPISVVYPPVAVGELEQAVDISPEGEKRREPVIIYIAQFRPEKNHQLILESFAAFVKTDTRAAREARLVLLGSVRDDADRKRVYKLRLMANELGVKDRVDFHLNASWPQVLDWLARASVGVNGMWNEHFGIGVVEYQAAGLISVVHDSGGPKLDIVTDVDGEPTGFHATTAQEFAEAYEKALSIPNPLAMRLRARRSAKRFTEEEFSRKWLAQMKRLVALSGPSPSPSGKN